MKSQFEDEAGGNPITPVGNNIGPYRGLNFQNFQLFQQAISGQGLQPNTKPNAALFGGAAQLVLGGTTGTLTSNYDGSNVKSFDLESLYFGCAVASVESTVNLPGACTVAFTAHDKLGNQLAKRTENFDGGQIEKYIEFGYYFKNVYSVDFTVQNVLSNLLLVGAADTLTYTVHSDKTQAD